MVFLKEFFIYPRPSVEAVRKTRRYKLIKMNETRVVLCKKYQMMVIPFMLVRIGILVESRTWSNIDFTTDDRMDTCRLHRLVKRHSTVHDSVISDRA